GDRPRSRPCPPEHAPGPAPRCRLRRPRPRPPRRPPLARAARLGGEDRSAVRARASSWRPWRPRLHQDLLLPEITEPAPDRRRLRDVELLGGTAHLPFEALELLLQLLRRSVECLRLRGGRLGDAHVIPLPDRPEDVVDGLHDRLGRDAVLPVEFLLPPAPA